ncbi:unnamed protein product [Rhizopus stolonifer]
MTTPSFASSVAIATSDVFVTTVYHLKLQVVHLRVPIATIPQYDHLQPLFLIDHLLLHDTNRNEEGIFNDEELEANHNVIIPKLHILVLDFSAEDPTIVNKRDYNNAFLNVCQAADWDDREKKCLFTIMDTYDLQPIASINDDDVEYNAPTHEKNLHAYQNDRMKMYPSVPKQSTFEGGQKRSRRHPYPFTVSPVPHYLICDNTP